MSSRIDDRIAFVGALRGHPDHDKLAALARRCFDRLGESRSLSVGRDAVAAMADELGVGQDLAIEGLRLRSVLERGPESKEEWAVVIGLALLRTSSELAAADGAGRARKLVRTADALEWLGVDVYGFFAAALEPAALTAAIGAMVDQTLEDAAQGRAGRAHALPRLEALATFTTPEAATARARLAHRIAGTPLEALFGAAGAERPGRVSFSARTAPTPPRSGFVGALRLVSGFALLQWLVRGLAWLAGVHTHADVVMDDSGVTLEARTQIAGRTVRTRNERYARSALLAAARVTRFPAVHLLVGALALALGIVFGGAVFADGVKSGETVLLLAGAGLVLGGALLDLLLAVVVPASRNRSTLELVVAPGKRLRLVDVVADDADAAVAAVARLRAGSEPT